MADTNCRNKEKTAMTNTVNTCMEPRFAYLAKLCRTAALGAALLVGVCAAMAENVLYIHPLNYDSSQSADGFATKNYAFADKITTSVTVAIWVKDMSAKYEKFIAGVNGRWNLAIIHSALAETNRKLAFRTEYGNALASGYVLNDGKWHFVVGTFNYDAANAANSFLRLYVDGARIAEKTDGIGALSTPERMFSVGASGNDMSSLGNLDWSQGMSGHFAELSVWNQALSDAEVNDLYARTTRLGGNERGLVAYWPLTGTPGMAAADYNFPNVAATSGVPNLTAYWTNFGDTNRIAIVNDNGFDKPYVRCVASPEWSAAHSYVQPVDATGRSWDDPLTNLVAVAAAAASHERILCSPGTHRIASSMSPLVTYFYLGSQDPAMGASCPETAIIDAQERCRHFTSTDQTAGHQSNFIVENLTFVNGREAIGGSMYFRLKTGRISNCLFHDNAATNGNGGAYYSYTAKGTVVSNCQFYGNSANNNGGAVCLTQNAESTTDFQRFADCVFSNNTVTAKSGNRNGGGVYCNRKVELENCLFSDNTGLAYGGQAYVGVYSILKGCVFTGSCNAQYGSCLWINKNPATVTNCVFRNMTVTGTSYRFIDFENSGSGSAFIDCVFTNNANKTALFYQGSKNLLFRQCLIADNASDKAVLPDLAGSAVFENCTIAQAIVTPASLSATTTNTFVNCIIPNATITSAGNYCHILSNCLVKTAQNGPFDSGVITGNPRFTDATHGDYTLKGGSPCREQGQTLGWMTAGSKDLAGNPRVVDRDGVAFSAAALPDLGCYENQDRPRGTVMTVK